MKILAASDTHFPFYITKDEWPDIDVFIHAGDLLLEGWHSEWYPALASLKYAPGEHKLYCPGNHDKLVEEFPALAANDLNGVGVDLIDSTFMLPNGMSGLAIPYVVNLRGWAYNREEDWLMDWLNQFDPPDVVVSHGPPYKTLDAIHPEESNAKNREHVGSKAMKKWFTSLKKKPLLWICGHIHESYGHKDIDGCHFYNVSMCDSRYKQSNSPVLIEV